MCRNQPARAKILGELGRFRDVEIARAPIGNRAAVTLYGPSRSTMPSSA
jgi:hypothetical protein